MKYHSKKGKIYQSPTVLPLDLALELSFCQSLRFRIQVDELENMNDPNDPTGDYNGESFYFES